MAPDVILQRDRSCCSASLLVSSVLVFAFMAVLPGDPARVALGVNASDAGGGRAAAAVRPRPAAGGAVPRVGRRAAARATSGESYVSRAAIGPQVADRLQVTLVARRHRHGHRARHRGAARHADGGAAPPARRACCSPALSQVGVAVPAFLAGILLITVFAVKLGWLPANGWTPPGAGPRRCSSGSSSCPRWRSDSCRARC